MKLSKTQFVSGLDLAESFYHEASKPILEANFPDLKYSAALLDEPTSSVDTVNERLIYAGLFEKFKNKCIVSAVHRLHLLEMFDYIYLFNQGRIVESGSFKTLMQKSGELAKMYSAYRVQESNGG